MRAQLISVCLGAHCSVGVIFITQCPVVGRTRKLLWMAYSGT